MYISPALVSHTAKDPACSHFPRAVVAVSAKVVVVVVDIATLDIATLAAVSEIVLMKASDVCGIMCWHNLATFDPITVPLPTHRIRSIHCKKPMHTFPSMRRPSCGTNPYISLRQAL